MPEILTKIGKAFEGWDTWVLKSGIVKNDPGEWGNEPAESPTKVIRSTNFTNEGLLNLENVALRKISDDKINELSLKENEIIIERSGGSNNQPVGRIGFIDSIIDDENFIFANFIQRISLSKEYSSKYVYYCLQQLYEMGVTVSMQYQTTGIRNLDFKLYLRSILPKPPLPEQRAIASVLSKVDDAIAATKKTIAKAERLKKALMQNLLTGKLKPDGTRRNEDEFYTDEKFGKVPIGWEVKKVKDCFEFFPTSSYSRSKLTDQGECMYVHYGDIHTKFYCFIDVQYSQLPFVTFEMGEKYTKVKEGDLIMADASEDYDGVGKCVEVKNINDVKIISGLHTLHLRDKSDLFVNGYKGYMLNHEKVRNSILRTATGIKVYSVSKSSLANILLPVPPKEEQIFIAKRIDTMNNSIQAKELKIQKLERLKKALMQNLLTGKKRLKADYIQGFSNG